MIAVIGAGPAGLMAAEILIKAGQDVAVFERKPSPGRKFLMAGRGGLNLTHSEDLEAFIGRYGSAANRLKPSIINFPPSALREWCEQLGEPTFIGTSGRVFPKSFKATPLLRAWIGRLEKLGVRFAYGKEWLGFNADGALIFSNTPFKADATLLALGGASWPRLGSDGSWVHILKERSIKIAPLRPSNCGFTVSWSDIFRRRAAGQPLKPVALSFDGRSVQGEAMITEQGIEGGGIYALSAPLRNAIDRDGHATLLLDLRPGLARQELTARLQKPRGRQSLSNVLRKDAGLGAVAASLLREGGNDPASLPAQELASLIKAFPLRLESAFPIDRAISSAGGIMLDELDDSFMLKSMPGVFAAGEMLDWEAPTGGYLLQATFATAYAAAHGVLGWLNDDGAGASGQSRAAGS